MGTQITENGPDETSPPFRYSTWSTAPNPSVTRAGSVIARGFDCCRSSQATRSDSRHSRTPPRTPLDHLGAQRAPASTPHGQTKRPKGPPRASPYGPQATHKDLHGPPVRTGKTAKDSKEAYEQTLENHCAKWKPIWLFGARSHEMSVAQGRFGSPFNSTNKRIHQRTGGVGA